MMIASLVPERLEPPRGSDKRAGRAEGGRRGARTGIRMAGRSDPAVFPWTRERGACPMRIPERRARSRTKKVNTHLGNPGSM
jgi:hypothetical protein